jgi:hypothetical protein
LSASIAPSAAVVLEGIGQFLHRSFADFEPSKFGCKKLLDLIEKHPERFKVKWSAPAKKGASQVWVRMVGETGRKVLPARDH